ncbi:hypothetical protein [Paenibacillus planticolens]|uniref:Tail fiber protein n=1 Tax=Paenibacillus planticolens TaxID=2654976 RepID=A0ABX1ZMQ3_9BACL|nr:hypothetical protein [Paenibacillus planticolens]NOV01337.1 hypothetical protein [Paenibacillus planticolens]
MSTNTTNYSFKKPAQTDNYNVDDQNGNWDLADTSLKQQSDLHNTHKTAAVLDHPDGSVIDAKIGNRTIDDTVTAASGPDTPTRLWSKLANMIKAITGKSNWYTPPVTSIESLNSNKAPLASPDFTGTPTGPTGAADESTTQLATKAFVIGQAASTPPVMDGAATVGSSKRYARADHVHPTDTTRAAAARSISAGVGLTGGGDLTADRSLAVIFGGNGASSTAARSDHNHDAAYWSFNNLCWNNGQLEYNNGGVWTPVGNKFDKTAMTRIYSPLVPSMVVTGTYQPVYSLTGKGYMDFILMESTASDRILLKVTVDGVVVWEGLAINNNNSLFGMVNNRFYKNFVTAGNGYMVLLGHNGPLNLGPSYVDYPYYSPGATPSGNSQPLSVLNDSIYFSNSILIEAKTYSGGTVGALKYYYEGGKM